MLQVHYINSENKKGYTDSSGITLYYTPKLRQYNGAILAIGDASLSLKPGLPEVETEGICYQQCTQRMFKGSIYISAAINHMHSLGKSNAFIYDKRTVPTPEKMSFHMLFYEQYKHK